MQIGSVVWEEFYHIHTYTHTYTRNWSQYTRNAQYQTCFAGFDKFKVYTSTVLRSLLVNFTAVSDFQFIKFNVLCPECHSNVVSYLFQQRPSFRSSTMLFDGFHLRQAPFILQLVWQVFDSRVSHSSLLFVTYQLDLSATMKMWKLCKINEIIAK